jgi:hypothetical protein
MTDYSIPRIAFQDIELSYKEDVSDCDTLSVRGVLRQPAALAGYTFRVEMGIPSHRLDQLCNILSSSSHENIVEVFARGDDFMVTSFWNETLKSYLRRVETEIHENDCRSCGQRLRSYHQRRLGQSHRRSHRKQEEEDERTEPTTINLWRQIALPVTKALSFLHTQNITLGGALDLTSIVVATQNSDDPKQLLHIPTQVFLRDFSKAHQASVTAMDQLYRTEFLSEDTFQLGTILSEISLVQPLPQGGDAAAQLDDIIDICCHPDPYLRPTVRKVEKILCEVLRQPDRRLLGRAAAEDATPASGPSSLPSSPHRSHSHCPSSSSPKSPSTLVGWRRLMFAPAADTKSAVVPSMVPAEDSSSSSSRSSSSDPSGTAPNRPPLGLWRRIKSLSPLTKATTKATAATNISHHVHITVASTGGGEEF